MDKNDFKIVDSEEEFVALLKKHSLFREDDVTFDDLEEGTKYVYTGDDFVINAELFEEFDIGGLLIEGNVVIDDLSIDDIVSDYGVFCVSGNMRCKDLYYVTEMTGVSIGGNLSIENIFYTDCGNSVLQVNGNFNAKLAYISQCSVEVNGEETTDLDENTVTLADLKELGLNATADADPDEVIQAYFEDKKN